MDFAFYAVLFLIHLACSTLLYLKMQSMQVKRKLIRKRIIFFGIDFWLIILCLSVAAYYERQGELDLITIMMFMIPVFILALFSLRRVKSWME